MLEWVRVISRLVQLTRIKDRGLEAEPLADQPLAIFVIVLQKLAILAPFGLKFVSFWSHVNELNC